MGVKPHLLLSLGSHSKDAGDERHLPQDVSFFHATPLPFPKSLRKVDKEKQCSTREIRNLSTYTSRIVWLCISFHSCP